jgi:ankyrin repeat protein
MSFGRWLPAWRQPREKPAEVVDEGLYRRLITAIQQSESPTAIQAIVQSSPLLLRKTDANGWLPLHRAVYEGSPLEVVRAFVDEYPEALQAPNENGSLPLHCAAFSNAPVGVAGLLVDRYREALLVANHNGWLPLHFAAWRASVEMTQFLADLCPDALLATENNGELPLHLASLRASFEVVKCLTKKAPEALLIKQKLGWLPLHVAARCNASLEVVKCLVDHCPAALLVKENFGCLPLHWAARHKPLDVVRCLADRCPDALLVRDDFGCLPMHNAAQFATLEVVQYLADKSPQSLLTSDDSGSLPLQIAHERNTKRPDVAIWLEAAMRKLEGRDRVTRGRVPMVAPVLGPGQSRQDRDREHQYDLQHLIRLIKESQSMEVVKEVVMSNPLLLQKADGDGRLPLHHAARSKASLNIIHFFVDTWDQALQEKDSCGWLPLHIAARYEAPFAVVQYLVTQGPMALLERDVDGWTPLHHAAKCASIEVVRCLVNKCEQALGEEENERKRPVDLAREYNQEHSDVVIWLETATRDRRLNLASARTPDPPTQDRDRMQNAEEHPSDEPITTPIPDPYAQDRMCIRKAMEPTSCEPTLVSVAYVESIRTKTFLGDGFFGTVFKGKDSVLEQEFAIKSINPDILRGGTQQDIERALNTFRKEQKVCWLGRAHVALHSREMSQASYRCWCSCPAGVVALQAPEHHNPVCIHRPDRQRNCRRMLSIVRVGRKGVVR